MNTHSKLPEVIGKALLVRPRYSPGLMLQDDDLTQAVDYVRELSRLMFKTLFGCGVMCGFRVRLEEKCGKLYVIVDEGVAMDCHGDPIQMPEPQRIPLDESCGVDIPDQFWIIIRRREYCCAPRDVACAPEEDDTAAVCTRVRDGFEIRLVKEAPVTACSCIKDDDGRNGKGGRKDLEQRGTTEQWTEGADERRRTIYADPEDPCYRDHYLGECVCGCESDWVVLARIYTVKRDGDDRNQQTDRKVDHSVRRFIRPVLMRDRAMDDDRAQDK